MEGAWWGWWGAWLSKKTTLETTLAVQVVGLEVGRQLRLPLVAVVEQLLLVVEQLLVRLGRELEVGALDDGVDGARLLQ